MNRGVRYAWTLSLALLVLESAACSRRGKPGAPAQPPVPPSPASPSSASQSSGATDYEALGSKLMQSESLGGIRIGQKEADVIARLGDAPARGPLELWGADGQYHQEWKYPALGITLDFCAEKEGDPKALASIRAQAPCAFKTARAVGVGSAVGEVRRAYRAELNPEASEGGQVVVAGSVYGGISFQIRDRRVIQVFIGAAAE